MADINWGLVAPVLILQVFLQIVALANLLDTKQLKGPKWMWAVIILLTGIVGPVLYFTIARKDE